jgi:hypothetical protein
MTVEALGGRYFVDVIFNAKDAEAVGIIGVFAINEIGLPGARLDQSAESVVLDWIDRAWSNDFTRQFDDQFEMLLSDWIDNQTD